MKPALIASELRNHAPFTTFGTMTGVIIMAVFVQFQISKEVSSFLFWITHPLHIFKRAGYNRDV